MPSLHKQLPEACTPHEKTALASNLIEATDGQIDGARLHAQKEEEIRIVQEADKR